MQRQILTLRVEGRITVYEESNSSKYLDEM